MNEESLHNNAATDTNKNVTNLHILCERQWFLHVLQASHVRFSFWGISSPFSLKQFSAYLRQV